MRIVYLVKQNADLCEGRGPMITKAVTLKSDVAHNIAMFLEPYGNKNQFCSVSEMIVTESFEEYKNDIEDRDRKNALNKLSEREKKLLGLI